MQVKIALVGKYTNLTDSYLSVVKVGQESFFKYKNITNMTSDTKSVLYCSIKLLMIK